MIVKQDVEVATYPFLRPCYSFIFKIVLIVHETIKFRNVQDVMPDLSAERGKFICKLVMVAELKTIGLMTYNHLLIHCQIMNRKILKSQMISLRIHISRL